MTTLPAPMPPPDLARRVGVLNRDDPLPSFDEIGRGSRDVVFALLPDGWQLDGRRLLDFGCGPGRLLRYFLADADRCEFYGCDIHEPSVEWVQQNLCPPMHAFVCSEVPPLPLPDAHVDVVTAMSVFTHITEHWADWLLELHRILRPGGYLIATFLGEGMSMSIAQEEWNADRIGMNVLRPWLGWDLGGPVVQHSEWWLREHWGRLFDVRRIEDGPQPRHGLIAARKRPEVITRQQIIRASDDPRETLAAAHNVDQLIRESLQLARERDQAVADQAVAVREAAWAQTAFNSVVGSRSWRATGPLRALARRARSLR